MYCITHGRKDLGLDFGCNYSARDTFIRCTLSYMNFVPYIGPGNICYGGWNKVHSGTVPEQRISVLSVPCAIQELHPFSERQGWCVHLITCQCSTKWRYSKSVEYFQKFSLFTMSIGCFSIPLPISFSTMWWKPHYIPSIKSWMYFY